MVIKCSTITEVMVQWYNGWSTFASCLSYLVIWFQLVLPTYISKTTRKCNPINNIRFLVYRCAIFNVTKDS